MKIVKQDWKPRRTGLISKVREAFVQGRKSVLLKTAVDVYGAQNLITQIDQRLGVKTGIRLRDNKIILVINSALPRASLVKSRGNKLSKRIRRAVLSLKSDDCLVLTTPLEAHRFIRIRTGLRANHGVRVRTMRNCNNLLVWKE